ncbi:MAG TPA: hypothetical protein PLW70_04065 [Bacteroidales bacterium]|jgi:hypothetical protein|nr:hypothetical protein [Bacteroidales bacterium]HON20490.1 hypothetical protein [Bacteroidales bacterium]
MKHRIVIIISCLLALNLQLRADNYLLLKNPTYKNYVYSAKEQMFLFGYNVSFPLVKNNLLINPCELYFGVVSKTGIYGKLKTNFNFKSGYKNPLTFNSEFRDIEKTRHQRFGGVVGVLMHIADPVFLHFGLGYGYRVQQVNLSCYKDGVGAYTEKYYYNRYNSIDIEAGVIVKIQMVTISVGASVLPITKTKSKPYFEISSGVGIALENND